ncbi:MAG: helix-turn-helix transcriptional regulator [Proteobacteria bacterium]|nr:helix-turn-helix transcriptional regulator [Pseudomonadota bacterium]
MPVRSRRPLSELEGVSLGIIYKEQPCTAYHVRSELKEAPSSHWRASAGSVYPLLARLEAEGLVSTTTDKNDGRGRKLLKVTTEGRQSLKAWVVAGADQDLISSVTDPIRSRTFFLDVLSAAERGEYLDQTIALTESFLSETKEHLGQRKKSDDLYEYLGSLGGVKVTEARLSWLRVVRKELLKS